MGQGQKQLEEVYLSWGMLSIIVGPGIVKLILEVKVGEGLVRVSNILGEVEGLEWLREDVLCVRCDELMLTQGGRKS